MKKQNFIPAASKAEMSEPLLTPSEQLDLLCMGDPGYIREFIQTDAFDETVEAEFLKTADDDMLKFYMARHPLSEKGQITLASEKSDELLAFYLKYHVLAKSAGTVLNRRYGKDTWSRVKSFFSFNIAGKSLNAAR